MDYQKKLGLALAAAAMGFVAVPAGAAPAGGASSSPGGLAGYWVSTTTPSLQAGPQLDGAPSFRSNGQPIPLLPAVAKRVAERRGGHDDGKPFPDPDRSPCLTQGMPTVIAPPSRNPIEILEKSEQVSILLEYFRNFRIIRINTSHLEDPDPTFMGDSVGHWEGGALVVDTVAVTDHTNILGVIPHSDQLHIIERIRRTGPDTMEDRAVIDDPKTFSKPWIFVSRFRKVALHNLGEFPCGSSVDLDKVYDTADPQGR